ncbi:MAG: hypothetical protein RLN62_04315 [Rickettsiales bacterium]
MGRNLTIHHTDYKTLKGDCDLPGDKSIAIRALIMSAIFSDHPVKIYNLPNSEDVNACVDALEKLGCKFETHKKFLLFFPAKKWQNATVNAQNSRTTLALVIALAAVKHIEVKIVGDGVLSYRSLRDILDLTKQFGVEIEHTNFKLPIVVRTGVSTYPEEVFLAGSAQCKSLAILLAADSHQHTAFREAEPSRDHTERLLICNGWKKSPRGIRMFAMERLTDQPWMDEIYIPSDPSSAAFLMVLSAFAKDTHPIKLKAVCLNLHRLGFLEILYLNYAISNIRSQSGELVGDIYLEPGIEDAGRIDSRSINSNDLIDEFPILAVAACFLKEESILRLPERLQNKESDRIKAILDLLDRFEVSYSYKDYELRIKGGTAAKHKHITLEECMDHRIQKSAIIMAILTESSITLNHSEYLNVSFPGFLILLTSS